MTRTGRWVVIAVLVVAAAAVAVPRLISKRSGGGPAAASPARGTRVAVFVHTVRAEPLSERLSTTGTLRANEQIEITSEISGLVKGVRFQEGARVSQGDVLVELDASELDAQRARARHRVEQATREEERQSRLLADGLVSQQEYDRASTELDVLLADLRLMDAQFEKTLVRAPFEGVIGLRYVSPGAYVTPQTRIASLQDLDPMKVDFAVPERYVNRLHVGRSVTLAVAGVDRRFDARVYAIEPAIDPETRSVIVRAQLPNEGRHLRPGAFADVAVVIAEVPNALTVPSVAVIPELGGKKVMVVEGGKAVARAVETGIRTDTAVEVTSGLKAGEQVITGGLDRVTDGALVEVKDSP
jgi:membrane fusion protein (multidrug efflux system)